jgi:steroid 5-alpha reductase family enzyme
MEKEVNKGARERWRDMMQRWPVTSLKLDSYLTQKQQSLPHRHLILKYHRTQ